jgi:threonine synthase
MSTRCKTLRLLPEEAIVRGLSHDGGLFVPEMIPNLRRVSLESMVEMSYQQRAVYVMSRFLETFTTAELSDFATKAYSREKFDDAAIAPVRKVGNCTYFLELWHGPTSAFKDMALQMLPHLLTASLQKTGQKSTVCILVATSGDTGKAALEGFCNVPQTRIIVFYPKTGVSEVQELQMVTQRGRNVGVFGVRGNFDDAQDGVKRIFSDEQFREALESRGYILSSANSINWGRALPQIVYYISAYCDLVHGGHINMGDEVNVAVPTGNFGNILAAWYAKQMGLPIKRLVCASNSNNVLTEFIRTGTYNKNRRFYTTTSPSMDILISSNLERLLFELTDHNDDEVKEYMRELAASGKYTVMPSLRRKIQECFSAEFCDDAEAAAAIQYLYRNQNYLTDTHTAVAFCCLQKYRSESGDDTPSIVVSTASPFKFCSSVLDAIGIQSSFSGVEMISEMEQMLNMKAPKGLSDLKDAPVRFKWVIGKENMPEVVDRMLKPIKTGV